MKWVLPLSGRGRPTVAPSRPKLVRRFENAQRLPVSRDAVIPVSRNDVAPPCQAKRLLVHARSSRSLRRCSSRGGQDALTPGLTDRKMRIRAAGGVADPKSKRLAGGWPDTPWEDWRPQRDVGESPPAGFNVLDAAVPSHPPSHSDFAQGSCGPDPIRERRYDNGIENIVFIGFLAEVMQRIGWSYAGTMTIASSAKRIRRLPGDARKSSAPHCGRGRLVRGEGERVDRRLGSRAQSPRTPQRVKCSSTVSVRKPRA